MKFASPNDETVAARDEAFLRTFLAGNKTAFAQAFWENGDRELSESSDEESLEGSN